ncbi:MAG: hypothetical protein JO108_34260 [Acidobacteriaceae bacterium]|nr:hypothetical protein [Acidobacteriaceae bacterium]
MQPSRFADALCPYRTRLDDTSQHVCSRFPRSPAQTNRGRPSQNSVVNIWRKDAFVSGRIEERWIEAEHAVHAGISAGFYESETSLQSFVQWPYLHDGQYVHQLK